MAEKEIGEVTHYFGRLGVVAIKLTDSLKVGDRIRILGKTTDFEQEVTSMQLEHEPIEHGKAGQEIALRVAQRAREKDKVYKIG
ncbi:MAG: hypothetical protein ACUVV0_13970 [Anaerolineae bacterium]